ncbi:hypothetical protein N431DRAFT_468105 [Stipitochalara longipes BDJ]|nr:hypothetical protein N431DRAFT_468105 [Stipitochalara longipes BDJ]
MASEKPECDIMEVKKTAPIDMKTKAKRSSDEGSLETGTKENLKTNEEQQACSVDFTLFPKLPLELRFMSWRFALPRPQFITITRGNYKHCSKLGFSLRACFDHLPSIRIPTSFDLSISHTNYEARQLSLQTHVFKHFSGFLQRPLYVNFSQDVFFFIQSMRFSNFKIILKKRHLK